MMTSLSDRSNYKTLNDYTYLNQASLGLVPETAVGAMHCFLDNVARHGNALMSDQEELDFLEPIRSKGAKLLNASPDNICISSSASEILSQVPLIFQFPKKNKVVLVSTDFPSLTRPWLALKKMNNNFITKFVDDTSSSNLTESLINEIDSQTAMICVSYVQFSTGTKVDIKRLRQATNEAGALLVLDITQSAGAIPIDIINIKPDMVVSSGYKWLGGHGGIALGYFSDTLLESQPRATGWMSTQNPFETRAMELDFPKNARKYTQSTMSYLTVKGLELSVGELIELNPSRIEKHSLSLSSYLLKTIKGTKWNAFREIDSPERSPNILSLRNQKIDSKKLSQRLKDKKIVCSLRNERLRVSIAHYNSQEDIDALLEVLL